MLASAQKPTLVDSCREGTVAVAFYGSLLRTQHKPVIRAVAQITGLFPKAALIYCRQHTTCVHRDSNTALQIFDIDHVIAELSQGMTLKAGTIIATGTPAGVGMGMDPSQFLKPGDVVRCEIEGIGTLTNPVK